MTRYDEEAMLLVDDAEELSGTDGDYDPTSSAQNLSFTRKLYEILNDERNRGIISWHRDGKCFEVLDPRGLEVQVLPKYFRHTRFQSLVRQLNFYAFKKVGKERSSWIYYHDCFRRDQPELLNDLKRKTNGGAREALAAKARAKLQKMKERSEARVRREKSFGSTFEPVSSNESFRRTTRALSLDTAQTTICSVSSSSSSSSPCVKPSTLLHRVSPSFPSFSLSALCFDSANVVMEDKPLFVENFFSCCAMCSPPAHVISQSSDECDEDNAPFCASNSNGFQHHAVLVDMFRDALYDRSLSVSQLDALLLLLFQLQTPEADLQTQYFACFQQQVLHLLHKHETLSHDLAQYMQALDVTLDSLPYFRARAALLQEPHRALELHNVLLSIGLSGPFSGNLTESQASKVLLHFACYAMNLLHDLRQSLSEDQHISCDNGHFNIVAFFAQTDIALLELKTLHTALLC